MERPTPVSGIAKRTSADGTVSTVKLSAAELSSLAFLRSEFTQSELSNLLVTFSDGSERRPFRCIET